MIKALLLSLSLGTFLSYVDTKPLPASDGHRSNAGPHRILKRSTSNTNKVSIWLESAKGNTNDAAEALEESEASSLLKEDLKDAKKALDEVNTTSSELLAEGLSSALWYGARALHDMLSEYNTTGKEFSEIKLLNAIYHETGACIDLTTALGEAIGNPTLKASVSDTAKVLQKELLLSSGGTEFLNHALELAKKVLIETENHSYVQSTV